MTSMARFAGVLAMTILMLACNGTRSAQSAPDKTGVMRGRIVGHDQAHNLLTVDHEKVGDMMDPMIMPYFVKGAKVAQLPPDGARFIATLHEQNGQYWLSDVHSAP
jgi:hypothetical protein